MRAGLAAMLGSGLPQGDITVAGALAAMRPLPGPTPGGPAISVVVCTRDRVQQLERALSSIAPSLGPADELLVIDNASRDHTVESLLRQRFPAARFVRENRPGLSWARNRAIIEARSEVIAFCDDDCVMDPGSLPTLRALLARNPDIDAVTGLVEPLSLESSSEHLFDRYFAADHRYQRRWVHAPRAESIAPSVGNTGLYGTGASLAIRRRVFGQVGVFDAALGAGTACDAGDDLEFLFRVLKHGGMLACEPRISVRHEHRSGVHELERQVEGWSRGFGCAVERTKRAFPEERLAYTILMARIAVLYHARRAATQPAIRRLALAELRGLWSARGRYDAARRNAEGIASSISSPAEDSPPGRPGSAYAGNGQVKASHVSIELTAITEPLRLEPGLHLLAMEVTRNGRFIGSATVSPSRDGVVGVDRLHDLIIDNLAPALMVRSWTDAVAESRTILQQNLLKVRRGQ